MKETVEFQGRAKEAKNPHNWSTALRGSTALSPGSSYLGAPAAAPPA